MNGTIMPSRHDKLKGHPIIMRVDTTKSTEHVEIRDAFTYLPSRSSTDNVWNQEGRARILSENSDGVTQILEKCAVLMEKSASDNTRLIELYFKHAGLPGDIVQQYYEQVRFTCNDAGMNFKIMSLCMISGSFSWYNFKQLIFTILGVVHYASLYASRKFGKTIGRQDYDMENFYWTKTISYLLLFRIGGSIISTDAVAIDEIELAAERVRRDSRTMAEKLSWLEELERSNWWVSSHVREIALGVQNQKPNTWTRWFEKNLVHNLGWYYVYRGRVAKPKHLPEKGYISRVYKVLLKANLRGEHHPNVLAEANRAFEQVGGWFTASPLPQTHRHIGELSTQTTFSFVSQWTGGTVRDLSDTMLVLVILGFLARTPWVWGFPVVSLVLRTLRGEHTIPTRKQLGDVVLARNKAVGRTLLPWEEPTEERPLLENGPAGAAAAAPAAPFRIEDAKKNSFGRRKKKTSSFGRRKKKTSSFGRRKKRNSSARKMKNYRRK